MGFADRFIPESRLNFITKTDLGKVHHDWLDGIWDLIPLSCSQSSEAGLDYCVVYLTGSKR